MPKSKEAQKRANEKWLSNPENKRKRAENQRRYRKENGSELYKKALNKRKEKHREKFEEYMKDKSCIQCGESRRPCLCFHHRNPDDKKMQVPQMVNHNYGWETILAEIEKCDILCHNCHMFLHYNEEQQT